jgi:hypothetical protein
MSCLGKVWYVIVRLGKVCQGKMWLDGVWSGIGWAWYGRVRLSLVWLVLEWQGMVVRGRASSGSVRRG